MVSTWRCSVFLVVCCLSVYLVASDRMTRRRRALVGEEALIQLLEGQYATQIGQYCNNYVVASWGYNTDVANQTKAEELNTKLLDYSSFKKDQWELHFKSLVSNWSEADDPNLRRQLKFLTVLGTSALNESLLTELNSCQTRMENVYSTAKICPYRDQGCNLTANGLSLDPGIESVISSSRDYDELTYAWKSWRDVTGPKMREDYKKYVEINNIAAAENGFSDNGEMWRSSFESETFIADMDALWEQVRPLYDELHKYVRAKLRGVYGNKMDDSDGLLPAHILGNMWAQNWVNLFDIMQPYPEGTLVDVTAALIQQNYTVLRMFETSDAFYQSLGLPTNSMSYDETRAMLVRPPDGREVVCHASAWDFCDGADFRIKMCTKINMEDFVTIHHEMGHIQYYIQYKDQPDTLRSGANPGFHEAIGDTIALSVATPQHLEKIGLLENYEDTPENSINALMQMALEKIAFLPFGLLIDKWRWDVFSGAVNETQWNDHWWYYRGISETPTKIIKENIDAEDLIEIESELASVTVDLRSGKTSLSFIAQGESAITPSRIRSYSPVTSPCKVIPSREDTTDKEVTIMPQDDNQQILAVLQELSQMVNSNRDQFRQIEERMDQHLAIRSTGSGSSSRRPISSFSSSRAPVKVTMTNPITNDLVLGNDEDIVGSPGSREEEYALRHFIEQYELSPELWNPTNPLYSKKAARNSALDLLIPILMRINLGANKREDVKKKKSKNFKSSKFLPVAKKEIQKVKPPVTRTAEDFDPGAKYHVPGDSQYISYFVAHILQFQFHKAMSMFQVLYGPHLTVSVPTKPCLCSRYFVAHILQFQFHKALCIAAGQYDPTDPNTQPLHKCDIYNSTAAGQKLSDGLKLGRSVHWKQILYNMTGDSNLDGSAILEYFQPLHEYLRAANETAAASTPTAADQVVPIVVGCVLGALVVIVVTGYLVMRRRKAQGGEGGAHGSGSFVVVLVDRRGGCSSHGERL
uniref:Angiotensin-converting enzyme n=1 Tax=Timema genevievae TaxID=629358 RepID=A0A7R9PK40_TIMGE|nr:unnamed protein product [Timema genevievae]